MSINPEFTTEQKRYMQSLKLLKDHNDFQQSLTKSTSRHNLIRITEDQANKDSLSNFGTGLKGIKKLRNERLERDSTKNGGKYRNINKRTRKRRTKGLKSKNKSLK